MDGGGAVGVRGEGESGEKSGSIGVVAYVVAARGKEVECEEGGVDGLASRRGGDAFFNGDVGAYARGGEAHGAVGGEPVEAAAGEHNAAVGAACKGYARAGVMVGGVAESAGKQPLYGFSSGLRLYAERHHGGSCNRGNYVEFSGGEE